MSKEGCCGSVAAAAADEERRAAGERMALGDEVEEDDEVVVAEEGSEDGLPPAEDDEDEEALTAARPRRVVLPLVARGEEAVTFWRKTREPGLVTARRIFALGQFPIVCPWSGIREMFARLFGIRTKLKFREN